MTICIRNAGHDDIQAMLPLLEALFSIEADFNFDPAVQAKGLALMLDGCGKHRVVKLACQGKQIIGMCTAQTRISTARGGITAVVEDLVVHHKARGQGIGSLLVAAIEDWARDRGIGFLQLLADRDNDRGLAFYRSRNWQDTHLICLTRCI